MYFENVAVWYLVKLLTLIMHNLRYLYKYRVLVRLTPKSVRERERKRGMGGSEGKREREG